MSGASKAYNIESFSGESDGKIEGKILGFNPKTTSSGTTLFWVINSLGGVKNHCIRDEHFCPFAVKLLTR